MKRTTLVLVLLSSTWALPALGYWYVRAGHARQLAGTQLVDSFPFGMWLGPAKMVAISWMIVILALWLWHFWVERRVRRRSGPFMDQ